MLKCDNLIAFEKEEHKYIVKETGQELLSVSTIIDLFKEPFDPDGSILIRKAKKLGVKPEELRAQWDKKRDDACDRGTLFHDSVEHLIKHKKILDNEYKDIVLKFKKKKPKGKLQSEVLLYSIEDGIAGTTDLVAWQNDNTFSILDFKTNEKLTSYNPHGKKLLPPLSHLFEHKLNLYTLQLNLYMYLIEKQGFWCNELHIIYVNHKTRDIEFIKVPQMYKEVKLILEHFKKHRQEIMTIRNDLKF